MAKRKKDNNSIGIIKLHFGVTRTQLQNGSGVSNRLFFFYVTPTGAEMNLNMCKDMKSKFTRPAPRVNDQEWESMVEYNLYQPIRLKMVNLYTSWGQKGRKTYIFIDIDGVSEKLTLSGVEGFGGIECRGTIDYDMTTLHEQDLIKYHGYDIIGPATSLTVDPKHAPRKMIW